MHKKNKKYRQIIETGKTLFWKYGIKRVSIEEICREANVSKMTFYKFFSNKNKLVKHILEQVFKEGIDEYNNILSSDKSYKEKVVDMALIKMNATNEISHEFLRDFYNLEDTELKEYMQQLSEERISVVMNDIIEAQKNGDVRQDIKPEFIMYYLNHISVMAKDPSLSNLYPSAQDMIMELMNFYFYGVLPRPDKGQ